MTTARIYDVQIRHVRAAPVTHRVRYRTHLWFVDLDDLPSRPPLVSFRAADHLGDPRRSLRENVADLLAAHGVDAPGRITMLAAARSLGHVFDPLTVYWAHDGSGTVTATVAEVRNTYGGRHAYVVRADAAGRAEVDKAFYVSPFYDVSGRYRLRLPEPGDRLSLTVVLQRAAEPPFVASVHGVGRPATARSVGRALLRDPLVTRRSRAAITAHGVRLWARGLPVVPRPAGPPATAPTVAPSTVAPSVGAAIPR